MDTGGTWKDTWYSEGTSDHFEKWLWLWHRWQIPDILGTIQMASCQMKAGLTWHTTRRRRELSRFHSLWVTMRNFNLPVSAFTLLWKLECQKIWWRKCSACFIQQILGVVLLALRTPIWLTFVLYIGFIITCFWMWIYFFRLQTKYQAPIPWNVLVSPGLNFFKHLLKHLVTHFPFSRILKLCNYVTGILLHWRNHFRLFDHFLTHSHHNRLHSGSCKDFIQFYLMNFAKNNFP